MTENGSLKVKLTVIMEVMGTKEETIAGETYENQHTGPEYDVKPKRLHHGLVG